MSTQPTIQSGPAELLGDPRAIATEIGMAMLAQTSTETVAHCDDVVVISEAICRRLGIAGDELEDILAAARLHDVGKASIPTEIIEKPGPLSDDEWQLIRQHTVIGEQLLSHVDGLEGVLPLIRHSHERWDGRGYPDGLAGEEIPLGSRIIFCADAFHAIRSSRPYRPGTSAREALKEVSRNAGTQFDIGVVGALQEVVEELWLAPAAGRARMPRRLVALLLAISVGATGSAVARSGLFDGGSSSGGRDAASLCAGGTCDSPLDFSSGPPAGAAAEHLRSVALTAASAAAVAVRAPGAVTGADPAAVGRTEDAGTESATDEAPGNPGKSDAAGARAPGKPGSSSGSAPPGSRNPHGSPPGQGGGPPASNNPNGSPPGQGGGPPASNNPRGAPVGQKP